jgi:hypothetical protein
MDFYRIHKKKILIILGVLIVIAGAYFLILHFKKRETYVRTVPVVSRDVVAEAGNMNFSIQGVDIQLKNGEATVDGLPGIVKMMSKSLEIDFNKDTIMDRAVIIKNERDDGSMYFYTSVVLVGSDGTLTNTNTISLGEGSLIQRMLELPNNTFSIEYLERKSKNDSPTIPRKRTFQVEGYALTEIVKK